MGPGRPWQRLASFGDQVKQIAFGYNKDIYLVSKQAAPHGKAAHGRG